MKNDIGIFRVAVAAVIFNENNKILITKRGPKRDHHPNKWEITTGRVDQGETFEEGLRREIKEELNIEVEILQPFATFHFYRGVEKQEHLGVTFLCKYKSGDVKVDGIEEVDFKWVGLEEAKSILSDDGMIKRDVIKAFKIIHI